MPSGRIQTAPLRKGVCAGFQRARVYTANVQLNLIASGPSGNIVTPNAYVTPFSIPTSGNNYDENRNDPNLTLTTPVNITGATDVYALINAYSPVSGGTIGTITFNFGNNTSESVNLVAGGNVRDFYQGFFANSTTASNVQNAFTYTNASGGGGTGNVNTGSVGTYVVDEQDFSLGAMAVGQTLTSVVVTGNTSGDGTPIILGLTVGQSSSSAPGFPDVSVSFTSAVNARLVARVSALTPAGTTSNVVSVSGSGSAGATVAGSLNAEIVTSAGAGTTVTLTPGFLVGYLLAANAILQDVSGGALLADAAALSTLIGAANDTLFGGNGNATLVATSGAETIYGGTGANLLELGASTALANTLGTDTIIGSSASATINAGGSALFFGGGGTALFNALGASATLVGGGSETVNAGAASALVFGGTGALTFNAGSGASTIVSGASGATVTGGSTGLLYFGTGPTTYIAGTATDTVLGFTGTLTATGGANGTLFFTGTGGANNVSTGTGSSTIIGFGTGDTLTATGSGTDIIAASGASETINGANSTGANTYFAFGANDSVIGGAGTTAIESGLGNHTLVAGSGSTLFEILAGTLNRAITIGNFNATQDFVQLQGYGAGAGAAALQHAAVIGGSEVLTLGDGTTVTFQGTTRLGSGSFV